MAISMLLREHGLRQNALAAGVGLSPQVLNRILNGHRTLRASRALKIHRWLNDHGCSISLEDVCRLDEVPPTPEGRHRPESAEFIHDLRDPRA